MSTKEPTPLMPFTPPEGEADGPPVKPAEKVRDEKGRAVVVVCECGCNFLDHENGHGCKCGTCNRWRPKRLHR